jgi:hypothetical protein
MIEKVINMLSEDLINLPYIDVYGGLVRTAKKAFTNENGVYYKTFPVSCDFKECHDDSVLQALVPNEDYKSLSYFESAGNVNVTNDYANFKIKAPVDFICWLNLPKLGIDNCDTSDFELNIIKFFSRKFDLLHHNFLKINVVSLASRDSKIFDKYSYGDLLGLLLYPFGFFKISLIIEFTIDPKCIDDIVIGDPIYCD